MNFSLAKVFIFVVFACNVFAVTVETMDEQVNSNNLTVLRLRINNEIGEPIYNTRVKYFVSGVLGRPVVDAYDLGGASLGVDSLNENLWAVTVTVDTLPSGIFPYESGICLGIHNANWLPRDKNLDPSYIASSSFVVNDRVELNVGGNHLPDAKPLVLFSGMRMLLDEGDSVRFAWHGIPNAEKYRLSVYSSDSQLVYQKETYGYSEPVALDAGDYLWRVEAKNSATEYGIAGSGAGAQLQSLSVREKASLHIQEQEYYGIESVSGHKDTPMLVVGWGEYADLREWDRPHLNRTFLDENEAFSCWAIAIKNLNNFYGGNLSLDEIRWYVKKNKTVSSFDSINAFGFLTEAEALPYETQAGLKYALDSTASYARVANTDGPLTYADVKTHLQKGREILIDISWGDKGNTHHIMLIDAFITAVEGNILRCINVDNVGSQGYFWADSLFKKTSWYILVDAPQSVRNMDPLLGVEKYNMYDSWIEWTDSDGDGVTDFDEVYRFGTNPKLVDSDSDGVDDKDEIHSYTLLEKSRLNLTGSYVGAYADLTQMRLIGGIEREYMADVDDDGLRAELDPDSDNDGLLDGIDPEPYKPNGASDSLEINELPKDVMLYALKQLIVNDGTTCSNSMLDYCSYVSEDTSSDYGMFMGARASAARLFARNNVFIRSNPENTFIVNYYGSDNLATARPDGKMTIDRHFRAENWPWKLNIVLPSFDEGDSVLIVQSGDTCFLGDNDHFRMLKVESGGVVYFPVGNVYIGDLQLDAGSLVKFEDQSRNTVLYVKGKILWKSRFSYKTGFGFTYDFVARHFKLVYSGIGRVFFDTNWYGTIIAPKARIILGQTNAKNLYGQFYANEIVIHQYSNLNLVPFEWEQGGLEYAFLYGMLKW